MFMTKFHGPASGVARYHIACHPEACWAQMSEIAGDSSSTGVGGDSDVDCAASSSRVAAVPAPRHGSLCMCLILASDSGRWTWDGRAEVPARWTEILAGGDSLVVGVGLATSWSLSRASEPAAPPEGLAAMREQARRASRGSSELFGFIESTIVEVATLVTPRALAGRSVSAMLRHLNGELVSTVRPGHTASLVPETFQSIAARWRSSAREGLKIVSCSYVPALARRIVQGTWPCLNVVVVSGKVNRKLLFVPSRPSFERLQAFRQSVLRDRGSDGGSDGPLGKLPKWHEQMRDPADVLDWLEASSFLKDQRKTKDASMWRRSVLSHRLLF